MRELQAVRVAPKAGGKARQLVVLVHGYGASGHDLIDISAAWDTALPRAAFAAPDAAEPHPDTPFGRQWFDLSDRDPPRLARLVAAAAADLAGFVAEELDRLGLPPAAVALMGFSQGAMVSLHTGLRRPVAPRAVLAFAGALLDLAALPAVLPPAPVLLVHGEADEVVPASRSVDTAARLRELGVPVETLFVPRLGHSIDDAGLSAGALFLQRAFASDT